jgi:hypothetical protein
MDLGMPHINPFFNEVGEGVDEHAGSRMSFTTPSS